MNHPMGSPAVGDNAATDQRVPDAHTIANLEFLLRVLPPSSAVETNTNYLEIERRLATRGGHPVSQNQNIYRNPGCVLRVRVAEIGSRILARGQTAAELNLRAHLIAL